MAKPLVQLWTEYLHFESFALRASSGGYFHTWEGEQIIQIKSMLKFQVLLSNGVSGNGVGREGVNRGGQLADGASWWRWRMGGEHAVSWLVLIYVFNSTEYVDIFHHQVGARTHQEAR